MPRVERWVINYMLGVTVTAHYTDGTCRQWGPGDLDYEWALDQAVKSDFAEVSAFAEED